MASDTFGSARRPAGKEFRDGTVGEALDDLYADIDAAFAASEQTGAELRANLHMDAVPTAGDTVTIGADTYEFRGAAGQMSNDTFIGVLIGGDVQTSLDNLGNAINGAGTGADDGILDNAGTAPCAVVNGTEPVGAMAAAAADLAIQMLDTNGDVAQGFPATDIALGDTLTDMGDQWNLANLQAGATTATGARMCVLGPIVYDAALAVAGDPGTIIFRVPFLPRTHTVVAKVTGTGLSIDDGTDTPVTYAADGTTGGALVTIDIATGVGGALTADGSEDITVVVYE